MRNQLDIATQILCIPNTPLNLCQEPERTVHVVADFMTHILVDVQYEGHHEYS